MPDPTLIYARLRRPVGGCNIVRMEEPLRAVAARWPGARLHFETGPIGLRVYRPGERRRLFVWQRPMIRWPQDAALMRGLLEHDYLIVHELDDWPEHPGYAEHRFIGFRAVHAVQVSTPAIADFVRRHNPNLAIFPNQLGALPPLAPAGARAEVVIFLGALNREADARAILPALNRVLAACPHARVEIIHDEAFFRALETPRKRFTPLCPYEEYRRIMAGSDIAVLPLAATEFNHAKSDLKFLEAASHGLAVLASPVVYAGTVRDGETGLLFGDAESFEAQLLRLLNDAGLRRRLGTAAHAYVAGHRMLDQHADARVAWYRALLDNHAALTGDLLRRTPELGASS